MKNLFNHLILLLALAASLLALQGCAVDSRNDMQSELYKRYASRDGLTVSQVRGMRINDSVKIDVLILVADDAKVWQDCTVEFDIRNSEGVASWIGAPAHPERRVAWDGNPCCKVIASPAKQTISIYTLQNDVEYQSLLDYQLNLLMNTK